MYVKAHGPISPGSGAHGAAQILHLAKAQGIIMESSQHRGAFRATSTSTSTMSLQRLHRRTSVYEVWNQENAA